MAAALQHYSCFLRCYCGYVCGPALVNSHLLAWLEVKGVTLNFLNYVCLLQPIFSPKSVFERLGFLQSNFCQLYDTPRLVRNELVIYCNLAA